MCILHVPVHRDLDLCVCMCVFEGVGGGVHMVYESLLRQVAHTRILKIQYKTKNTTSTFIIQMSLVSTYWHITTLDSGTGNLYPDGLS